MQEMRWIDNNIDWTGQNFMDEQRLMQDRHQWEEIIARYTAG